MSESIASGLPGSSRPEDSQSKADGPQPSSGPAIRFAATAVGLGLLLFGLFRVPWVQTRILIPYAEAQQRLAGWVSGLDSLPVIVSFACTGADVIALCVATVLAFPAPWRKRIQGVVLGLLLITAVNTVRIGSLSALAGDKKLFETFHVVVWPAVLIIVVSLYVFLWMRWAGAAARAKRAQATGVAETPQSSRERSVPVRFALWLVPLTILFVVGSGWYLDAPWILTATHWTAISAAGLMTLLGVASKVTGSTLSTVHGAFIVTPTCIATPLVPVYFAAALALPMSRVRRAAWLLAGPLVFLALGVLRLLVLALPEFLVPSYSNAIHAFNSLLFALILVSLAAYLGRRTPHEPVALLARRTAAAGTLGALVAFLAGATWGRAIEPLSSALLGLFGHAAHTIADTQGATTLLPAFQFGLFAALALAFVPAERRPMRRLAPLAGLLALSQVLVYLLFTELWIHARIEPHVRDQRAWMVAAPVLLAWWLDGRGLRSLLPRRDVTPALPERA